MDTGVLRGICTAVLIVAFVGMWLWAYSAKRRSSFEAAARAPLEEDPPHTPDTKGQDRS